MPLGRTVTRYAVGYIRKSKRDDDSAEAQRAAVLAIAAKAGDRISPAELAAPPA